MIRWHDVRSQREVWVIEQWPAAPPWPCMHFALLVATDRPIDASQLPERLLEQGLAAIEAWGPNCVAIERAFDQLVVGSDETAENVLLTTSHPHDPFATSLEWFLDMFEVAEAYRPTCNAWVILALGTAEIVERELLARRAHRR